jgi:hypothetical protein
MHWLKISRFHFKRKEKKLMKNRFKSVIFILIPIIIHLTGCSGARHMQSLKTGVELPGNDDEERSLGLVGLKSKKIEVETEGKEYTYALSPPKVDNPDEYMRREIESFLCACIPDYIRSENTYRVATDGHYIVKATAVIVEQTESVEKHEIRKWFEDRVTVMSKGNVTMLDTIVIKRFFDRINQVIGRKKFLYNPGLEAANIIIELAMPDTTPIIPKYLGETTILDDNLVVRLTINNGKVQVQTFKAGLGKLINKTRQIRLTAQENEFRKENRLVKVYIENVLDPRIRYNSLVHELFHAIGFPGHSPYYESNLFPFPVESYSGHTGVFSDTVFCELAARMVEMLYRPEILAGMTVKEAGEVLSRLKHRDKTAKGEIIAYLLSRRKELEVQKKVLLEEGKENFDERMILYIELDKWVRKEQSLLEELKEINVDYRIDTKVVKKIRETDSSVVKLSLLRTELILLESTKRRLLAEGKKAGNISQRIRRQIRFCDEQIVVLNDLMKVVREIVKVEQQTETARAFKKKAQIEEAVRRVLRQLSCIQTELSSFMQ